MKTNQEAQKQLVRKTKKENKSYEKNKDYLLYLPMTVNANNKNNG